MSLETILRKVLIYQVSGRRSIGRPSIYMIEDKNAAHEKTENASQGLLFSILVALALVSII